MTKAEMLEFIVFAVRELEGAEPDISEYEGYTEEQLAEEVEWYDYLLDK